MSSFALTASARSIVGLVLLYAIVGLVFVTQGRPNIDEGMFLSAARLVADGRLPYRDFPFSQAPMLPYAYALAPTLFGSALLGGRTISFVAGVIGVAAALWLARRLAGGFAALITLLLTLATLPSLWVAMTVRSQSMGTPLLVLGVAALALPRQSAWSWSVAPSLLLWASSMRLTNLTVFAAVSLWVAWQLRGVPARLARVIALLAAHAFVICLPVLRAPEDALFHLVTAQLTRGERFGYIVQLSFLGDMMRKLDAYLDLAPDAALLLILTLATALGWVRSMRHGWRPNLAEPMGDPRTAQITLVLLGVVAFAPHLALSNSFLEYLIPLWALLAPAIGIGVATGLGRRSQARAVRCGIAACLLTFACINAAVSGNVWIGTRAASFSSFRSAARQLAGLGGPNCTMLTFETELAVEAGCRVLPGLEYSFFSYFAQMPTEEAEQRGVLDLALLRQRVADAPPDLIVLGRAHPKLLLGRENEERAEARSLQRDRRVGPLEFLGPLDRLYTFWGRVQIPSGVRRPGEPDAASLSVYRRNAGERGRIVR